MTARHFSLLDRLLATADRALSTVAGSPLAARQSPAYALPHTELESLERRHAAGLMRINQTGEVCAQALYDGQAALARDEATRDYLRHAAAEETDHLAWCNQRLDELDSHASVLNPLWYAGSFAMGAAASLVGDRFSLGFVVETERQVEAHLADHLERLPAADDRSRAILVQMQADESRHARGAEERGGAPLRFPLPGLMRLASAMMKSVAYRI